MRLPWGKVSAHGRRGSAAPLTLQTVPLLANRTVPATEVFEGSQGGPMTQR